LLQIALAFIWSLLVALFAVPTIIRVAYSKKILDIPNYRKVHEDLIPRLGGVAIFTGFMTAVTIFGRMENGVQQLLAGTLVIFFVGVKDDIIDVSVFKKFFVQVLACGIIMFIADIRITSFQGIFNVDELSIGYSYAFTFLVVLCITNSVNLIDGLDGLAGSIVLIASIVFGVYFFPVLPSYTFVAFSLAGGVLGFLRYNMVGAKIFMGDTGSLVCGFILSVLAIQFIEHHVMPTAPSMAVAILFIPLFDTIRVFAIRIYNGNSPFSADRNHVHHNLLRRDMSHLKVVITLSLVNVIVIALAISLSGFGDTFLLGVLAGLSLVLSIALELGGKKERVEIKA
jgi:UDP-N-acetylmuramyl pentapeptide phosphotransferase/UDP-N-acetylglucosamine-1-phosphate transferase